MTKMHNGKEKPLQHSCHPSDSAEERSVSVVDPGMASRAWICRPTVTRLECPQDERESHHRRQAMVPQSVCRWSSKSHI